MHGKFGRIVVVLLALSIFTLMMSSTLAAGISGSRPRESRIPPFPNIQDQYELTSRSDVALNKLSPDLRVPAKESQKSEHFVYVLVTPGTNIAKFMIRSTTSKPLGEYQWVAGEVASANLIKLASAEGVISVTSFDTFKPNPAPGLDELRGSSPVVTRDDFDKLLAEGGKVGVLKATGARVLLPERQMLPMSGERGPQPNATDSVKVADIHRATEAHDAGYKGEGVVAAVVDSGVDFANPDLIGTQARVAGGTYDGWPFSYDTLSGIYYAMDSESTLGPDNFWSAAFNTMYAHTMPIEEFECAENVCTGELMIDYGSLSGYPWPPVSLDFTWPDTSLSDTYFYTVHPNYYHLNAAYMLGVGYAWDYFAPAAVILSDEATAGVYDTVYADADFDQDLADEKPMTKGDELSGADLFDATNTAGTDGVWDLSVSMLTWIADGVNPPPGVGVLYEGVAVPEAGRLIAFVNDADSHGTNVASMIAAQGNMTDPNWLGPVNPNFAGAADVGGVGGPVLAGMAPDTKIAVFMNGFILPFDSWVLAGLGFDGVPESGDEAQVVNNSWGDSGTVEDGWDPTSRFVAYLNHYFAPTTMYLAATGNGGPGYGSTTSPNGSSVVKVGASTSYGSTVYFEFVGPDQFTYGAIQPWSNRGPSSLGDVDPDIACVGAWGLGANPLNFYYNGERAYDLFGGTSMANPVCTGVAALAYQAFHEAHDRWPTWQEAADILSNGAHDLGYNVLAQGAGNADAMRTTSIAAGEEILVTPAQWMPGDYRGVNYTPEFPAIVHPGDTATGTLTFHNPTDVPKTVALEDVSLQQVHEVTFTVTLNAGNLSFVVPDYLSEITALIDEHDPDLIRAHTMMPYTVFDMGNDGSYDNRVISLFYDWTDLNEDGNLWEDENENDLVDLDEIDNPNEGVFEYNRYGYAYGATNYDVVDIGRDALSRRHDGVFFGLQRVAGTDDIDVTVSLIFYKKADWNWLSLSAPSVTIPANGTATINATMTVPADGRLGVYEGAIEFDGQLVPVITHVAANSGTFEFGAATLEEKLGDTPYDNGHLFGSIDWGWRPETGDWKHFFYDLDETTTGPGKAMVVETEWVYPEGSSEPQPPPPPPPSFFLEQFEGGVPPVDWSVINNIESCSWMSTDPENRPNTSGGAGEAAVANSDGCGPDTVMDTELWSPVLDLSSYENVWLSFRTSFIGTTDEFGSPFSWGNVDVSTNGGADWTNLLQLYGFTGAYGQVLDLSDFAGEDEVMLRFHYISNVWDWWWMVDEVTLYDTNPSDSFIIEYPDITDVDTTIFGPSEDELSTSDPAIFGPGNVQSLGSSENWWLGGGQWLFQTTTNTSKEVVGATIENEGLGFISLHNVLNAGRITGEPVVGNTYELSVDPAPLNGVADTIVQAKPVKMGTEIAVSIEATADIEEGLVISAYGLSQPIDKIGEVVHQDDPNSVCSATWAEEVVIEHGALIEAVTSSPAAGLDIDLFLFRDGGDGVYDCIDDSLLAASTTSTADEFIRMVKPPDGRYWVVVHGWNVPGGTATFDIHIKAIGGHDLEVMNLDEGPVTAGEPVTFDLKATLDYVPGSEWQGILFVGPEDAPTALSVPVTVTIPEAAEGELNTNIVAQPDALETGETTTVSLRVENASLSEESVSVQIVIPPGLVVKPGTINASQGVTFFDLPNKAITWTNVLGANEEMTLTFEATATSLAGMVDVQATISGLTRLTDETIAAPVWINVERPPRLLLMPVVVK